MSVKLCLFCFLFFLASLTFELTGDASPMRVDSLSVGYNHSCVLLGDGTVKCWGRNYAGQLGLGHKKKLGTIPSHMGSNLQTVALGKGEKVRSLSAGAAFTCALLFDHSVKCWGKNGSGQLGVGHNYDIGSQPLQMGDKLKKVDLGKGAKVQSIDAGYGHVCALLKDGSVKCWGRGKAGQLGTGDSHFIGDQKGEMGDSLQAVDLGKGRFAVAISVGGNASCALLDNGTVKCWGENNQGELGQEDIRNRGDQPNEMGDQLAPINFGTGQRVRAISMGDEHGCVLLSEGSVKCWGENRYGKLGLGDSRRRGVKRGDMGDNLPKLNLNRDQKIESVSVGANHSCVLYEDRTLKCWGHNTSGELGIGDRSHRGDNPGELGETLNFTRLGVPVIKVSAGASFTCAVLANRAIKCWGLGRLGQLGLGDDTNRGDELGEMGNNLPFLNLWY